MSLRAALDSPRDHHHHHHASCHLTPVRSSSHSSQATAERSKVQLGAPSRALQSAAVSAAPSAPTCSCERRPERSKVQSPPRPARGIISSASSLWEHLHPPAPLGGMHASSGGTAHTPAPPREAPQPSLLFPSASEALTPCSSRVGGGRQAWRQPCSSAPSWAGW